MENFEKINTNETNINKDVWEEGEPLLDPNEQERLNHYRKKQINGELTDEERADFQRLQQKESEAKTGPKLTEEEENELRELRKTQIDREFTPEELERFQYLQNKE
ncbi:MAG: hypothetical protein ACQESA_00255 [Patescibacteria group bacterium]